MTVTAIVNHKTFGNENVISVGWHALGMISRVNTVVGTVGNKRDEKLAERLVRAINEGKAVTNIRIQKDIHGVDYVTGEQHFIGRTLNADLKRLGY